MAFWMIALGSMPVVAQRSLDYFIGQAHKNSPLIVSYRNQKAIDAEEMVRLKAAYTHSRLELSGDWLVVPILTKDDGTTRFKVDAQNASSYAGYDLGQTSSHLNAGLSWMKPLTGAKGLKDEVDLLKISQALSDNQIQLTEHELTRLVTEQYLLCELDEENQHSFQAIDTLIANEMEMVTKLSNRGLASPTDVQLLKIERQSNDNRKQAARQSFLAHHAELNTLCGIQDTTTLVPAAIDLQPLPASSSSAFLQQYRLDSLQAHAQYRTYLNLYRPQLSAYADAGTQTGVFQDVYKRWGASAGLHLSWTLSDGKQLQNRKRQMKLQQNTTEVERQHTQLVRQTNLRSALEQIKLQDLQIHQADHQLADYVKLLSDFQKEILAGRRSAVDYVNLLQSYRQQVSALNEMKINRKLLVNTYNYWNW